MLLIINHILPTIMNHVASQGFHDNWTNRMEKISKKHLFANSMFHTTLRITLDQFVSRERKKIRVLFGQA